MTATNRSLESPPILRSSRRRTPRTSSAKRSATGARPGPSPVGRLDVASHRWATWRSAPVARPPRAPRAVRLGVHLRMAPHSPGRAGPREAPGCQPACAPARRPRGHRRRCRGPIVRTGCRARPRRRVAVASVRSHGRSRPVGRGRPAQRSRQWPRRATGGRRQMPRVGNSIRTASRSRSLVDTEPRMRSCRRRRPCRHPAPRRPSMPSRSVGTGSPANPRTTTSSQPASLSHVPTRPRWIVRAVLDDQHRRLALRDHHVSRSGAGCRSRAPRSHDRAAA